MAEKESLPKLEIPDDVQQEARAGYDRFLARASSRVAPHSDVGIILTCHLLLQHQLIDNIAALNPTRATAALLSATGVRSRRWCRDGGDSDQGSALPGGAGSPHPDRRDGAGSPQG